MVYLHAGSGDQIHRSVCNPLGVQQGLTRTWLSKTSMTLGMVTIHIRSTTAKMAKSAISGDRPG